MDENIIIPIIINKDTALAELKKFGSEAKSAVGAIGGGAPGNVTVNVFVKTLNAVSDMRTLSQAGNQTGSALKTLRESAGNASGGMQDMSGKVATLTRGLIELAQGGTPSIGMIRSLVGIMAGGGGLGVAIGGVSIALALGIKYLTEYREKTEKAKEAAKKLADEQKEFEKIKAQSNKTAAEQIATLNQLAAEVGNVELNTKRRKKALKELQDMYPSYLKNVSLDDAANGNLANTITTRLVPAIIAAAKARAYQEKINKLTAENIELEEKALKLNQDNAKAKTEYQSKNAKAGPALSTGSAGYGVNFSAAQGNANKAADEAHKKWVIATKAVQDNEAAVLKNELSIIAYSNTVSSLIPQTGNIGLNGKDIAAGAASAKTKLSEAGHAAGGFTNAQKKLATQTAFLESQLEKGLITPLEFAKGKLKLITKTLEEFQTKFKQAPDSTLIKGLEEQARHMQTVAQKLELRNTGPLVTELPSQKVKPKIQFAAPDIYIQPENMYAARETLIAKLKNLGVTEVGGIQLNDIQAKFKLDEDSLTASEKMAEHQINSLRDTIGTAAVDGLTGIGEGLGDALSGVEGLGGIFNKVGNVLGNAMKMFGKEMIQSGVTMLMAKRAFKALLSNPYTAIAAGIALVALGTALSNKLNKKSEQPIGGFADGGGAYSPMMAWFGESPRTSRNNPELAMRKDQMLAAVEGAVKDTLRQHHGAGMGEMRNTAVLQGNVVFEIHGDRLVGVLRRTELRQARNF